MGVFNKEKNPISQEQKYKLTLTNVKIAWNKFNKDVFIIIIFKDLFLILDKIILKDSKGDKNKDKEKDNQGDGTDRKLQNKKSKNIETNSILIREQSKENSSTTKLNFTNINNEEEAEEEEDEEMSEEEEDENKNLKPQTSLNFTINNPQIVVQNEIKGSALLLICKEPIKLEFNNYYFRNDLKYYKLKNKKPDVYYHIDIPAKSDLIYNSFYLGLRDYVILYVILTFMSYVISLKFAKSIFKKSQNHNNPL